MYEHKDGAVLKKTCEADLRFLLEMKAESWWGTHGTLVANPHDQQKWFDALPDDQLYMTVFYKPDDWSGDVVRVGVAVYTAIDRTGRTCGISGSVLKGHREPATVRAGFVAGVDFAFEILNMHRLESEVLAYHEASYRLQTELLGFSVEGVRRKAVYKCGRYYDSVMLSLLREEWESQPRVLAHGGSCNKTFNPEKARKHCLATTARS